VEPVSGAINNTITTMETNNTNNSIRPIKALVELLTFSHENLSDALYKVAVYIESNPDKDWTDPDLSCGYDEHSGEYYVSITTNYQL
jgi:hypothetical protein